MPLRRTRDFAIVNKQSIDFSAHEYTAWPVRKHDRHPFVVEYVGALQLDKLVVDQLIDAIIDHLDQEAYPYLVEQQDGVGWLYVNQLSSLQDENPSE